MTVRYCFLLLVALLIAAPVNAQDAGPSSKPAVSADMTERLALARKMHDVWPIRTRIESAINSIAENYPEEQQPQIKAAMRKAISFSEVEEESIKAMADIYTPKELQTMIDFYGSDTGRAISAKTPDYERAITPVMMKMVDKAMLDMRTGAPR